MDNATTYNIIVGGECQKGFDIQNVQNSFATLFKVSPEKASALLRQPRILKKGVDLATAHSYKRKLENIGLVVNLKAQTTAPSAPLGLSLAPIEAPTPDVGTETPDEQRENVVIPDARLDTTRPPEYDTEAPASPDSFALKSAAIAICAAVGGALLWKGIASVTGYELGLIAWAIGGAIGLASTMSGGGGQKAALFCAALALVSVCTGRYLIIADYIDDFTDVTSSQEAREQWLGEYEASMITAAAFTDVAGEQELRQFMVDEGLSEAYYPEDISDEELELFRQNQEPMLVHLAYGKPDFDQWMEETVTQQVESISVMDVLKESFSFMDLIFLFLGVSTAYRLGKGSFGLPQ